MDVLPIVVHVDPFDDSYAVKVLPLRCSRTQCGAVDNDPLAFNELPPVVGRHWNATPLAADTSAKAPLEELAEPAIETDPMSPCAQGLGRLVDPPPDDVPPVVKLQTGPVAVTPAIVLDTIFQ